MTINILLYIGGSYPQLPGIRSAKQSGLFVVVVDRNTQAPGGKIADDFIVSDATDFETIKHILTERAYVPVIAYGVADYAYATIGQIYDLYGVVYGDSKLYAITSSKVKSKFRFNGEKVKTPQSISYSVEQELPIEEIKTLSFPVIVKPSDSYNGQGVNTVYEHNRQDLELAALKSSEYSQQILIEEFIEGRHFNLDFIFDKNESTLIAITERFFSGGLGHEAICGVQREFNADLTRHLSGTAKLAARSVGINYGPVTVDLIVRLNVIYVLEVSPHLHSIATNLLANGYTGLEYWFDQNSKSIAKERKGAKYAGYYNLYLDLEGIVECIEIRECENLMVKVHDTHVVLIEASTVIRDRGRTLVAIVWFTSHDCVDNKSLDDCFSEYVVVNMI